MRDIKAEVRQKQEDVVMYYSATSYDDRRRAQRLKAKLTAHYELKAEKKYGNLLTQDISEGGIRMLSDGFIPRLSKVAVQLNLTPHKLVELNGEIRWSQRAAYSNYYQTGLEFRDVSPDIKRSISEYVAAHS